MVSPETLGAVLLADGVYLVKVENNRVISVNIPGDPLGSMTLDQASDRYLKPALSALRNMVNGFANGGPALRH